MADEHTPYYRALTSRTSSVLIVASLQRLKMEALIPTPADCEVRSVIKFLNAQSIAPNVIHRQLCQVYDHTRLDGQHISCRSSAGRCLIIILPIARTSRPVIFHNFLHLKKFLSGQRQRIQNDREAEMNVTDWCKSSAADFYDTGIQNLVTRYDKCGSSGGEHVEK